jgi:hypothetical protein
MVGITTSTTSSAAAKRISRFRQPGTSASDHGQEWINRARLGESARAQIDRIRREDTLAWMAHSVWISAWSLVVACLVVLFGVGGCVAVLLQRLPPLVSQANTPDVVMTIGCAFGLAIAAGLVSYGVTRALHPAPIRHGHRIRGPFYALLVGAGVTLGAFVLTMPWSFPSPNVLHDSAQQIETLVTDHQVLAGTVYQEPDVSDFYFETTIGAWIVAPLTTVGPASAYRLVTNAVGSDATPRLATVAKAIGSGQIHALRERVAYLWGLAGALCVGAIGACVVQRRRWNKPILVPPLADNLVREILATNGGTHMTVLRGHLS